MGRYSVPSMSVVTFRRRNGTGANRFHYHFRSRNGNVVVTGEGHPTRSKARRAARGLIRAVGGNPRRVNWVDK